MKRTFIAIIVLVIAALVIFFVVRSTKKDVDAPVVSNPEPVSLCYEYSKATPSGFFDRAWLKMDLTGAGGTQVTGEYRNLPAEKDSKVGTFTGTVGAMDPATSSRTADVWWNSMAEGMSVTEQLKLQFGEGSAVALFGEMVDRDDGTYVYKDATKLTPGFQMSQIDCGRLQDEISVEKYIRDNIATLAPAKPVLGGTWYATTVYVNSATKTGTVSYEDGHVQGAATFSYVRTGDGITISDVKKTK